MRNVKADLEGTDPAPDCRPGARGRVGGPSAEGCRGPASEGDPLTLHQTAGLGQEGQVGRMERKKVQGSSK